MSEDDYSKELLENDVKRAKDPTHPIPLHDYRPALQGAVSWLGDRYLLAEPVRRRGEDRRTHYPLAHAGTASSLILNRI